ncbi:hypothetical protein Fbal_0914 [Ferrimonas balearica DSM 9799]|uniref:Uncharacterized protein n=1 Tax=Ferrimonas balearica (strain DSM 9799 / CCM 4581 / KCTC 23876 / PAT) TaxID=550540 RepID=E1STJ0_FERBD|nr:hypothetical protein [Ferrimonas balearica]ADN75123.1 hypothetical protein Fbal_0914 [Ferrimonas balearica DSM 9799]
MTQTPTASRWQSVRGAMAPLLLKVVVAALVIGAVSYLTAQQDQAAHAVYQQAERIKLKLQMTGLR